MRFCKSLKILNSTSTINHEEDFGFSGKLELEDGNLPPLFLPRELFPLPLPLFALFLAVSFACFKCISATLSNTDCKFDKVGLGPCDEVPSNAISTNAAVSVLIKGRAYRLYSRMTYTPVKSPVTHTKPLTKSTLKF